MSKVQATRVFAEISKAKELGYTTVSEQGSSRSSKTYNTVIWLCVQCLKNPGTTVSIVRATLPSIKGSVLRDFVQIMRSLGAWDSCKFNKSDLICTFPNGSWVEFFSCDNEQKLRGRKRKILYVNEGNELRFIEWQQLQMRTTEFSIIDYNPSFSDDHWLCSLNKEERTYHFITTYKDNPFLEAKVVEEIESLKEKNPSLWRIYGMGLQAMVEGLVFENVEVVKEIPRWHRKHHYRGVDFGFAQDPTAIVDVYISGGALWLDEICYQTQMLSSDIIEALKNANRKCGENVEIVSESADPRLIAEIANAGLDIRPVKKFPGSIMAGIQKMQELRIKVTERSVNIVKELRNYTYRQSKDGRWLNEPIDAYNHCFAGSTLVTTEKGLRRIDGLKVGERVLTSAGYKRISRVFNNGEKAVSKYTLRTGGGQSYTVTCTPDHLIKTSEGWKRIQEIKPFDTVYTCSGFKARDTGSTRAKGTTQGGQSGCTVSFGSATTAKSPKDTTYTTRTGKRATTTSQTLKRATGMTAFPSMRKKITKMRNALKRLAGTWIRHAVMPTSGTGQRTGGNGTPFTPKWLQKLSSRKNSCACNAAQCSSRRKETQNFAPTTASLNTGVCGTVTMKNAFANGAEKLSRQINIQGLNAAHTIAVASMETQSGGVQTVYDIEVEEAHEYFANGLLVHNCIDAVRYVCLEKILGQNSNGMDADELIEFL